MANLIEQITEYIPVVDEAYVLGCKTSVLDGSVETDWNAKNKTFEVADFDTDGTSEYNGTYEDGAVTLRWTPYSPNFNQAIRLNIDWIENEESAGLPLSQTMSKFEKNKIYPQLDKFRISKYHQLGATKVEEDLSNGTAIITSLRKAFDTLTDDKEVDPENIICFIQSGLISQIKDLDTTKSRAILADLPNIVPMPSKRMFTNGEFVAKKGFQANSESKYINFILLDKQKVLQGNKRVFTKVFTPEENQNSDGYSMPYHMYGIAEILKNGREAVYSSVSTKAVL